VFRFSFLVSRFSLLAACHPGFVIIPGEPPVMSNE